LLKRSNAEEQRLPSAICTRDGGRELLEVSCSFALCWELHCSVSCQKNKTVNHREWNEKANDSNVARIHSCCADWAEALCSHFSTDVQCVMESQRDQFSPAAIASGFLL